MAMTEAQKRAIAKYDAVNAVRVGLKFIKSTDADILALLQEISAEPGGKQGYIKALIRADIERRAAK